MILAAKNLGMPEPETVDWMISGKTLDFTKTLQDENVSNGSSITVVVRGAAETKQEPKIQPAGQARSGEEEVE